MKTLVISLVMLAAASAFANEAADEQSNRLAFHGTASRAEVRADYQRAREAGTLPPTGEAAALQAPAAPLAMQAREDVRREARQAARQRLVHELL